MYLFTLEKQAIEWFLKDLSLFFINDNSMDILESCITLLLLHVSFNFLQVFLLKSILSIGHFILTNAHYFYSWSKNWYIDNIKYYYPMKFAKIKIGIKLQYLLTHMNCWLIFGMPIKPIPFFLFLPADKSLSFYIAKSQLNWFLFYSYNQSLLCHLQIRCFILL